MIGTSDDRWFAVGSSVNRDSLMAGEHAARRALRTAVPGTETLSPPADGTATDGTPAGGTATEERRGDAKLIMVFCSDNHDPGAVLAGINGVSGGVPLIGATTCGEIANEWSGDGSVVVTAIGGAGIDISTAIATNITGRQREAGIEIAACIDNLPPSTHRVLVMLPNGLAAQHLELLRGTYSMLGAAVPFVGGCAGDAMHLRQTRQLYGDDVHADAVVAVGIGSSAPFGIGVRHGWHQIGEPLIVTKTSGYSVLTINDQPAVDLYLRNLDAPDAAYHDHEAFSDFSVLHPLWLSHRSGGHEMRFILRADFDERALVLIAGIPYGTMIWLSGGDVETMLDATDEACQLALDGLSGRQAIGLITFDCVARKYALGSDGTEREVRRIAAKADGVPVSGFYTYGEIARTKGINSYHNQTLVVLALS